MKTIKQLLLLLFLLWTAFGYSQTSTSPVKVASVEGITEYRLDNGLRVLLFPDPSKQTITVNVTYLVGSKHENYGETGMAHLLEHMVFKGTEKHPDVKEEITQRGDRWNGTTWYDRTNYFETFPASDDNLEWAIEMEADRMVNSRVSKEDLESEMTVVRNEFEAGENNPINVMLQRMLSTAFLWHNYGKSTIGARSDIENVPIDRLQAFYRKYYQPDNAVLIVTGRIEEDKTLELVQQFFGAIPRPERELPVIYTKDPTQDGERQITLRRVGDIQALGAIYHIPAGTHPDFAGIDIATHVLSNDPSGRLYKNLVDTKLATQILGVNFQLEEPGVAAFGALTTKDADIEEVKDQLLATIDELTESPPTEEEVERARTALIKQMEQAFNSSEQICLQLSEWIGMGDWRLFFIHRDRLKGISTEDVQRIAKYYFKPDNRTVGLFIPTDNPAERRVEIPDAPDIEALVSDYKGQEAVAMGEAFDPSIDNIEKRTTYLELPNGMKVALLPKKTRGETVRLSMTLLNGDSESLKGKRTISQLTAAMLNRGTKKHSRQELEDALNESKATVNISGSNYFVMGAGETTRSNLEATLRLIAEMLQEPAFPEDEFEKLKGERITGIEFQRSEPNAQASNRLQRHLNPYPKDDVRYVPTFDEQLEALRNANREELEAFHQEFYGASQGTLAIVGDFDQKEVEALVTELFGSWESPVGFKPVKNEIQDVPLLNDNLETPDKANAFFFAAQEFPLTPDHEDYPALTLGFYMLGDGFQSRLVKRIREKDGLSYGVGGNFDAHPIDKIGTFNAFAIYAPENRDRLEAAFREEIEKVCQEGFSAEEVAAAKESWQKMRLVNQRAQDSFLARHLSLYLEWTRPLQWDAELEETVAALDHEAVNAAMRKHLKPDEIHMIKAGDFAGKGVIKP